MPDPPPADLSPTDHAEPRNAVLARMLERLYVALMRGPGLNCRPHSSRQRIDVTELDAFDDGPAVGVLRDLLSDKREVRLTANVPQPADYQSFGWNKKKPTPPKPEPEPEPKAETETPSDTPAVEGESPQATLEPVPESVEPVEPVEPSAEPVEPEEPAESTEVKAYRRQKSLLSKLRNLTDDAKTYEQDTGVHALNVGYPILSIPPAVSGGRRILAPVAFIPVALSVKAGGRPGIEMTCRGEGEDLIKPNPALMAWIERETGNAMPDDLFGDEEGKEPWREIEQLVATVTQLLEHADDAKATLSDAEAFTLEHTPRSDELPNEIKLLNSAVLGLFPASNQGLLRDTRQMMKQDGLDGPVASFVEAGVSLTEPARPIDVPEVGEDEPLGGAVAADDEPRNFGGERFVALADPCQGQTVKLARTSPGLVVHGPPGTGKSQTITNIIGDHLARGERVLFVCDKRTALDVVANRLRALGLDGLCAVVHDAQRDQRDLYMSIRAQLERLPDAKTHARAAGRVEKIDEELGTIYEELSSLNDALTRDEGHGSFHDMIGRWLSISAPTLPEDSLEGVTLDDLETHRRTVEVVLERGGAIRYPENGWAVCAGGTLDDYLSRRSDEMRQQLASVVEDGQAADLTVAEAIPPFDAEAALAEQTALRERVLGHLKWNAEHPDAVASERVAGLDGEESQRLHEALEGVAEHRTRLARAPLDEEIRLIVAEDPPSQRDIAEQVGTLEQYLQSASKWWGFIALGAKKQAALVLRPYGLKRTPEDAQRLVDFLQAYRSRIVLTVMAGRLVGEEPKAQVWQDDRLRDVMERYDRVLPLRSESAADAALAGRVQDALRDPTAAKQLMQGLEKSPARAEALTTLEASMRALGLFDERWLSDASARVRGGALIAAVLRKLEEGFDDLESVLRIKDGVAELPEAFKPAVRALLDGAVDPAMGMEALSKRVLTHELTRRVAADPKLNRLDPQTLEHNFQRYGELEDKKRDLVVDLILDRWRSLQKKRLLSGTGTRKNALGAALQQRLFVRGSRAMRLRQVVALGRNMTYEDGGGDPMFDMAPVWLASPETVAQVFPREAMFDVVIFDEASQCRLEEALPVLTRAKRVVIAGDPKQLPPTRFFEASIAVSDDGPIETEDDLFEAQQAEVEDLLAAALNLDVQESYLDVHYRSRNSDLIEFSNEQFYNDRLQAIPGHPRNRSQFPPLRLDRVSEPLYHERTNVPEAKRVVEIVDDLLKRAEPPSIGIACFNLAQRDLIAEMLDERAMEDGAFGRRLSKAKSREGEGSFEGLFVKNLENVQGDERDHIIISTTYGPNEEGKFYRRFGPLAMPGGGRRLNVLVTRARHEVHLVTSIPAEAYRSVDQVPEGASPSGGWLLFAYLRYAERLAELYEVNHKALEQAAVSEPSAYVRPTRNPSQFAAALGQELASQHGQPTDVFWGNDGFCVDLALHHPTRPEDVSIGVMCDFARFDLAPDAVQWDIYRMGILKWQGWTTHRLWTPTFFRDPVRSVNLALGEAQKQAGLSDAADEANEPTA